MERSALSEKFPIGSKLPDFTLRSTENTEINSVTFFKDAKAGLVIFTCNHCPYVRGTEVELNQLIKSSMGDGLKVIAISSNDPIQYPEDGFDKMQQKAKALNLPYPYLFDENQTIAKTFDAACTPECYLFDQKQNLIYHGSINDSPKDPSKASKAFLATAVEQALSGKTVEPSFVHPVGCSIKWKI